MTAATELALDAAREEIERLGQSLVKAQELRADALRSAGDAIAARELAYRERDAAARELAAVLADRDAARARAEYLDSLVTVGVLGEVAVERKAQDAEWGEQNHPSFRPGLCYGGIMDEPHARAVCDERAESGNVAYADILTEEYFEVMGTDTSSDNLDGDEHGNDAETRSELVQLSAVCVAMIEAIDRRSGEVTQ